jgi:glyoxylase-like metal-dependent hydrolase (beta-lactamase superfamily II)
LIDRPNPLLPFSEASAARYSLLDYSGLQAVAPGVVVVAAPGHTPGSQLVYVLLRAGTEILLVGDVSWTIAGVRQQEQKPLDVSGRLGEDRSQIATELVWLQALMRTTEVVVIPSHDGEWLRQLTLKGILQDTLALTPPPAP